MHVLFIYVAGRHGLGGGGGGLGVGGLRGLQRSLSPFVASERGLSLRAVRAVRLVLVDAEVLVVRRHEVAGAADYDGLLRPRGRRWLFPTGLVISALRRRRRRR